MQQTLKAGGFVPMTAKLGKDDAVDTVTARAYSHPVLPGRTVIRLTPESVAAGDDLEMATLGFAPGEDRGAVAKERRRPLGFPGWALVNDPKNARYALDVVKEFKKQARKAKSKPGHAKDGIDAIADKLGKSVPHFLPSFFEEAGRAFIEHGALSYAATMFGKAREAEATHALEVDEQHRVDGFLEFALAGAVTTKALGQYAKDLAEHHKPEVAYAHFRQLCLQRTLGGMPPWSGMSSDLRRLAKAAKLAPATEDAAFIADIIESPALGKAAGEFWRAYQEPIIALGKQSASVRGALLNLFPTGTSSGADLDDAWLDLLDATGASEALTGDVVSDVAQPNGGRAAWFDKLTQHLARNWWRDAPQSLRTFSLLRRMAPALIADGKPISCLSRWQIDLDLAELALELGVAVVPKENNRIDVNAWAQRAGDAERGRDPVRVAAHPNLGPLLAESVSHWIGKQPFDATSRGRQGFLAAKRAWLEKQIANAERGALPALEALLATIDSKVTAATFAEAPDLFTRFAALDTVPALARTLQIGIIDELGWPALEEVAAELDPDDTGELSVHGGPPVVVLASKTRAIAVGASGRLGSHDLVIPPKHVLGTIRFVGGEFLVFLKHAHKVVAYWSRAPHDRFDTEVTFWNTPEVVARAAVLPDGAWLEHERPIRTGERNVSIGRGLLAWDGATAWIEEFKDGQQRWRELTSTGERGRTSWPTFIAADPPAGSRILPASYVLPAPTASSPLGVANGLVGARLRQRSDSEGCATVEVEMIDGVRWSGTSTSPLSSLVRLPGGGAPRLLAEDTTRRQGSATTIVDPEGTIAGSIVANDRRQRAGQVAALPPTFWHHMVVRDEAGSRRLRQLDEADARALIAAVPISATGPTKALPQDVTAKVLREITHPRLRRGVTGFAVMAVELRSWHQRLVTERTPARASAEVLTRGPDDKTLREALAGWILTTWGADGSSWAEIQRVGAWFKSDDRSDRTVSEDNGTTIDWFTFAVAPCSLSFIATAIGTAAPLRPHVAELLGHLVSALPSSEKLCIYTTERTDVSAGYGTLSLRWANGHAYAIRRRGWSNVYHVLEFAPDGRFVLPAGYAPVHVTMPGRSAPNADDITAVAAAVRAGKTSWSPAAAERLAAATGLTHSEATFLWSGCPNSSNRSANFLPKELREQLGLKATQAAAARDSIAAVPLEQRIAMIDETARGGLEALLDGRAVDALVRTWTRAFGARVSIPEELIAAAGRALHSPIEPSQALAMIGAATQAPQLNVDGCWALHTGGALVRTGRAEPLVGQAALPTAEPAFDAAVLQTIALYVPYLAAELPVGHTLRAQAAAAHRLALTRLANPGLWLDGGSHYAYDDASKQTWQQIFDGIGGDVLSGFEGDQRARRVPGALLVRADFRYNLLLHPATLDAKASATVEKLVRQITYWQLSAWQVLQYVRSPGLAAIVARIENTPVPDGRWEQDPRASVPKLVEKVAKQRKLSPDAAALYLQYLVVLWPTPKNLQEWNGWNTKQIQAATDELLENKLLMTAKRERAQRNHFLPGGWEALKSPHPPMESWKLALYGMRDVQGTPVAPLGRFLALAPFHALFEAAWERVEGGDAPRYEEVVR